MTNQLTGENVFSNLIRFAIPYFVACFLQSFYGLADLYIVGQFRGSSAISAVSVGSQVIHMVTVIIVGLVMGTTVFLGKAIGGNDKKALAKGIGNTISLFAFVAVLMTIVFTVLTPMILRAMSIPTEAYAEAKDYLHICFLGIPFITAYNVISGIFRGLGDTRHPMYFVAVAGVLNVGLDYWFIGFLDLGAAGAAYATVIAQAVSVAVALVSVPHLQLPITFTRADLRFDAEIIRHIFLVGGPIAAQDGFIQIGFLIITIIANLRGVDTSAAVGIVEKIITFLFLVPSAMLSAVSAVSAQNIGAGMAHLAKRALRYGLWICVIYGVILAVIFQFIATPVVSLFAKGNAQVVILGAQYLRAYIFDCIVAGIHFCFSGYFAACGKSWISFLHNMVSIVAVRIPGCYLASVLFPESLYPMGWATPLGSLVSAIICVIAYRLIYCRQVQ